MHRSETYVPEITLDISDARIQELNLERQTDSDEISFSVTGHVRNVDGEKVGEIMRAQTAEPLSLTVQTD